MLFLILIIIEILNRIFYKLFNISNLSNIVKLKFNFYLILFFFMMYFLFVYILKIFKNIVEQIYLFFYIYDKNLNIIIIIIIFIIILLTLSLFKKITLNS